MSLGRIPLLLHRFFHFIFRFLRLYQKPNTYQYNTTKYYVFTFSAPKFLHPSSICLVIQLRYWVVGGTQEIVCMCVCVMR